MQDGLSKMNSTSLRPRWWRVPLFRLLAINLFIGVALAAVLVGGLLALNPGGRDGHRDHGDGPDGR